ncbi:hypothetical protein GT347_25465 [Xylophilus rhododendri]|uniref:Uncharacterized protein n=1 Tax=Xylophilus rhododendri TaxID=2697032 RepID=A0A857JE31_9BURK|nr:hypothetical protein [Xylophilus rhododendri]QHJ01039.1 hypothetical protein GT347_25465 [Xylophilus rhododendri]
MVFSQFDKALLPFEAKVLRATLDVLPPALTKRFDAQVSAINKVQRRLDWREIEFYCVSWFKVRWPQAELFDFRNEWRLATIDCTFAEHAVSVGVWAAGGHVFSLEAECPMRPLHRYSPFSITGAEFHELS